MNNIHPSATVHPSVEMGSFNTISAGAVITAGVVLGNFCVIEEEVVVGEGTRIRSFVELRKGTRVGRNCYIDSGVKSSGLNIIGDRVVLRYDCIVARGCNIADDCYICPQVMTNNLDHKKNEVGGAHVGSGCFIGTQTVLAAGINIAAGSVVGACSMVTKTIGESGVYMGVPARRK